MKFINIIFLGAIFLSGCHTSKPKIADKIDSLILSAIAGCSAGIESGDEISFGLKGDLKKAITDGVIDLGGSKKVDDWIRGYLNGKVSDKDKDSAYKAYLDCYEKERNLQLRHSHQETHGPLSPIFNEEGEGDINLNLNLEKD